MKLNIGSHSVRHEGFLNVDILPLENVDIVMDITKVPWAGRTIDGKIPQETGTVFTGVFMNDSVDEILMVEVLEHISFHDTVNVLREIYRVLKPGGKLHIQVPDCGSMMEMYADDTLGGNFPKKVSPLMPHKPTSLDSALNIKAETGACVHPRRWLMAFCGAQKYGVPDIHKNIFTKEIMQDNLEEAGFEHIDFNDDPLGWKIKVNVFK